MSKNPSKIKYLTLNVEEIALSINKQSKKWKIYMKGNLLISLMIGDIQYLLTIIEAAYKSKEKAIIQKK